MHRFMTITLLTIFCVTPMAWAGNTTISMPPPPPPTEAPIIQNNSETKSYSARTGATLGDVALYRYGWARTGPTYSYYTGPSRYGYYAPAWYGHGYSTLYFTFGSFGHGFHHGVFWGHRSFF